MYVAVAAAGGFLVGLVLATCVACAVTGSKAAARVFRGEEGGEGEERGEGPTNNFLLVCAQRPEGAEEQATQ